MTKATVRIVNRLGLHARPSAMLVTATSRYKSEVFFSKGELRVNGKSIMGVMMLAAEQNSELLIEVNGPDETAAMAEIKRVIESGFNEER
jgi:phosphocarrier protein HPr